jgi:hypothetical protein
MPNGRSQMMREAIASRRTPPVEIVDRPRSRNQWPSLPASQRVSAVGGFGLGLRMLAARPAHFPTVLLF